ERLAPGGAQRLARGGVRHVPGMPGGAWHFGVEVRDACKPEAAQRRDLQRDPFRDVADGVAALIAVGSSVRQFADADAVHHDHDRAAERRATGARSNWTPLSAS